MATGSVVIAGSLAAILVGVMTFDRGAPAYPPEFDDVEFAPLPVAPAGVDDAEAIELKTITELKADGRGHFVADARIDGTGIAVLVDTGASVVALSYEDAEAANLKPHTLAFDQPVATANGKAQAARVTLRRVEVNGVMVRDVQGLVMPKGAMRGTLLGMSFLSRLDSFSVEDGVLTLKD
jgi:clan AA aspartic protease (TIGR02281 family)